MNWTGSWDEDEASGAGERVWSSVLGLLRGDISGDLGFGGFGYFGCMALLILFLSLVLWV